MATEPRTSEPAPADQRHAWVPWLLAAAMLIAAAAILHQGRGTLPFFDEWNFIIERRGHSFETLLRAHNGHLVVAPLVVYKALLQVAGLTHYWVFRVALLALHLLVVLGVFGLARRRIGDVGALVAAALVLFCFAAADDLLWAFQISFLMAVGFGVWMLIGLDLDSRRGDLLACVCLIGSLASAAIGLPFALAALVIVGSDVRRWRRAWVVVVPLLLFAIWYFAYGVSALELGNAPAAPRYVAEMASNAAGSLVGLGVDYGRALMLALAAVVVVRFAAPRSVSRWLLALVVTAVGFWVLIALGRAEIGEPLAPRYIYPGAVLLVLVVVELLRGRRLAPAGAPVALLLVCLAGLANYATLGGFAAGLRANADVLEARLGALELVATRVPPSFQPVPREGPQITARGAAEAQKDFGRLGLTAAALSGASASQRAAADAVLLSLAEVTARKTGAVTGSAPNLRSVRAATSQPAGSCRRIVPTGSGSTVELLLPAGGSVVLASSAAVPVYLRRFAHRYGGEANLVVAPDAPTELTAGSDASAVPWTVEAKPSAPLTICAR